MTEKRFELYKMASTIKDNKTNIDYDCGVVGVNSDIFNLCNLLNSLSEENEQLKQDIKQVLFVLSCAELAFKLSVNETKAIKRLNDYVNGCFNTEKLGDVE